MTDHQPGRADRSPEGPSGPDTANVPTRPAHFAGPLEWSLRGGSFGTGWSLEKAWRRPRIRERSRRPGIILGSASIGHVTSDAVIPATSVSQSEELPSLGSEVGQLAGIALDG